MSREIHWIDFHLNAENVTCFHNSAIEHSRKEIPNSLKIKIL